MLLYYILFVNWCDSRFFLAWASRRIDFPSAKVRKVVSRADLRENIKNPALDMLLRQTEMSPRQLDISTELIFILFSVAPGP